MQGTKHLISCTCILPHLRGGGDTAFHSFVVFSQIGDDEEVIEKFAQCNNCGIIHKVVDICKSTITKKEDSPSIISEADIALSLPTELSNLLTTYSCDIATWEHTHFLYSYEKWGESIILTREEDKGMWNGKRLTILGKSQFRVEPYSFSEVTS